MKDYFFQCSMVFLGYVLLAESISANPRKVKILPLADCSTNSKNSTNRPRENQGEKIQVDGQILEGVQSPKII